MKLELHRTLCISNSGFRLNLKKMNINKGKCLSEKLVYFNPLLLIHKTVSANSTVFENRFSKGKLKNLPSQK